MLVTERRAIRGSGVFTRKGEEGLNGSNNL